MADKTVGGVAAVSGVSVRTLHHYDEIGLLRPAARSPGGYRLYGQDDLLRLQEILLWRSAGFPLAEIGPLLDAEGHDPEAALRMHRARLADELGALEARVRALDRLIARRARPEPLQDPDLRALFDGFEPSAYADEAEARWGDTPAWSQSRTRTAAYGPTEWARIKAESSELEAALAARMRDGAHADSPSVRALAEAHQAHIGRWFYDCPPDVHRGLADLLSSDPRFAEHYEREEPGLARFLADAVHALHGPRTRTL